MTSPRNLLVSIVTGGICFVALGPPIGSLAVTIPAVLLSDSPPGLIVFAAIMSHMGGAVPALATGLLAGAIVKYLSRAAFCIVVSLVGGAISFWFASFRMEPVVAWNHFFMVLQNYTTAGFFAGAIIAYLFKSLQPKLAYAP